MHKIIRQAALAFINAKEFSSGNTQVTVDHFAVPEFPTASRMYLHHNLIAVQHGHRVFLSLAGWGTPTTRRRLNGLLSVLEEHTGNQYPRFYQAKGHQYFGDQHVSSHEWIKVS